MNDDGRGRHSYQHSCERLQERGFLDPGDIPPIPGHRPQFDDETSGVCFFRTCVSEGDIEDMTLPQTFFGMSEVGPISFKNTDFSESTLCWNDFREVDFTVHLPVPIESGLLSRVSTASSTAGAPGGCWSKSSGSEAWDT